MFFAKIFPQFDCRFLSAADYHAGEKWVEGVMNHHDILDFRVMAQKKFLPDAGMQSSPRTTLKKDFPGLSSSYFFV
jgi:hypothetical protein